MTHGATLGGHVIKAAVERAGVDPAEIEDVLMGCALPEGATGGNIARQAAIARRAAGQRRRRHRQSLLLVRPADDRDGGAARDRRPRAGDGRRRRRVDLVRAGDAQPELRHRRVAEPEQARGVLDACCETAETVAKRYNISKEAQDEYGVQSQLRAAAARAAGRFNAEIVPMTVTAGVPDKATGAMLSKEVTVSEDEGIRADTTLEGVSKIRSAVPGRRGHRRQREPVLRRRVGLRRDGREARRTAQPDAARHLPRLRRRGLRARRNGHRPGVSRCRACSSARASRSTTSGCGN